MEAASRFITAAVNNNTVINVFLGGTLVALGLRSMNQQKHIDELETQKETLLKKNKAMKKLMWGWKQQLFAEAATDSVPVPLARLKAIYGEAPLTQTTGDASKQDAKSPAAKLLV